MDYLEANFADFGFSTVKYMFEREEEKRNNFLKSDLFWFWEQIKKKTKYFLSWLFGNFRKIIKALPQCRFRRNSFCISIIWEIIGQLWQYPHLAM